MTQEENWFEKTWGSILGRHSIKFDTGRMPKGVEPITWKDGSTTYNFQGKEYSNIKDVPVPRAEWIDKTASVLGESISKIPNIDKIGSVVAPIARTAEQLEHPFESQWAEMVGDSFQQYGIDRRIGVGVGYATFPGFGEVKAAKKAIKGSMELAPALARVDGSNIPVKGAGDFTPSNVFQHSSDARLDATSPRNWGEIRRAAEKGDITTTKQLLKESSPFYSTLAKRNKVITINQVAKDKDLILQLADRNTGTAQLFTDYVHATVRGDTKKAQAISRTLNDFASKNPFDPSDIIYGNKGIRDSLKNAFVEFTGQEWHHIFGNKEIGEAMLTKLAGEPMMAANIFKFLHKNKIPTSGIASNMGLASKAKHTGRGQSIHQWMKEFGLEPWTHPKLKGGELDLDSLKGKRAQDLPASKRVRKYQEGKFTAPLDLGDHLKAISKEVLAGNTEADEFIDILRSYGKFRDQFLLKKLKEFDMRIVSEIEGTERVILDKLYKPTIGTRGRKAR